MKNWINPSGHDTRFSWWIAGRGARESTDSGSPISSVCSSNTCWQRNRLAPPTVTVTTTPPPTEEGEEGAGGRSTSSGISRRTSTSSSVTGSSLSLFASGEGGSRARRRSWSTDRGRQSVRCSCAAWRRLLLPSKLISLANLKYCDSQMLRTSNYLVTAICGVNMVMTKNFLCSRMRLTPIHRESKKMFL